MCGKMKTNTVHACHSVAFGYVTEFPCSFRFFENSSTFPLAYAKIPRYFAHSKLRFIELSLAFLNFRFPTQHFFESPLNFRRKIREISFEISLKIRENKGRISLSLLLHSTVAFESVDKINLSVLSCGAVCSTPGGWLQLLKAWINSLMKF